MPQLFSFIIVLLLHVYLISSHGIIDEKVIKIKDGFVRGRIEKGLEASTIYAFEGIPYARPPIGHLRFKSPQPAEPWDGILDATTFGAKCPQFNLDTGEPEGNEDCLFLNVYTKQINHNCTCERLRPVMFFIHGGGFVSGSTQDGYGPAFLLTEDVVYVSIEYRFNAFGFLSCIDPNINVPGNAGMRDMVLGLKWVQKNIKHFGGDPDCVTIFGGGAGGGSVSFLYLSPMTRGLFHRAIAQSGNAKSSWAFTALRKFDQGFAPILGCSGSDYPEIFKCIRSKSTHEILEAQKIMDTQYVAETSPFVVVVEVPGNEEPFLAKRVETIISEGDFVSLPYMTGYNTDDGYVIPDFHVGGGHINFSDVQTLIPKYTGVILGTPKAQLIGQLIYDYYFHDAEECEIFNRTVRFYGDAIFKDRVYHTVKMQSEISQAPTYFYQFNYKTGLNRHGMERSCNIPVVYRDEMRYLTNTHSHPDLHLTPDEYIAMRRMVKMWTNFAKHGYPIPDEKCSLFEHVYWDPIMPDKFNYLLIDPHMRHKRDPELETMQFWKYIRHVASSTC